MQPAVALLIYRHPCPHAIEGFVGFGDNKTRAIADAIDQIQICCEQSEVEYQPSRVSRDIRLLGDEREIRKVRSDWLRVNRYKRLTEPRAAPGKKQRKTVLAEGS